MRKHGTSSQGFAFGSTTLWWVWSRATAVPGTDPNKFRKDTCGAWIAWNEHGNTDSPYGWEVDHVYPVALGGSDDLSNLQALQWENNRHKSDNVRWSCKVRAA